MQVRVLATIAALMLALAGGCGGGDDDSDDGLARPAPTTEAEPPPPAPAEPAVPGSERAAAIAVVSRYADALQAGRFARACARVSADVAACEAALERFARRSRVLRLARTVPVWDRGEIDSETGAITARVKIGFPARPEIRWTLRLVKKQGGRWRLVAAVPSEKRT